MYVLNEEDRDLYYKCQRIKLEKSASLSTEEVGLVERFVLEIELFGFCGTDWTELLFFLNCNSIYTQKGSLIWTCI